MKNRILFQAPLFFPEKRGFLRPKRPFCGNPQYTTRGFYAMFAL